MPERGNPDEEGAGHGSETVWLLCHDKVTRRKGVTDISSTLDNGYSPDPEEYQPHRNRSLIRLVSSTGEPSDPQTTINNSLNTKRQKNGTALAASTSHSGNPLPLFWHHPGECALKPPEHGLLHRWHGACYVSIKKIWSTGKGFPT